MEYDEGKFEKSVFSGIKWNLIISLGGQLTSVGFTMLLSRVLGPSEFGLIAAAMALTALIEMLGSLGGASALTQRKVLSDQFYSAALIVAGTLAALTMGTIMLSSALLANFYDKPQLQNVFLLLALSIPFQALEIFPLAELQRRIAFDKIAIVSIASILISGVVAVYLAFTGHGWIALGVRLLLVQIVRTVLFSVYAWPRFKFKPSFPEIKELLRFGVPQSLSNFFAMFGKKIDDILIGKWMGTGPLGIYSLAFNLSMWPVSNIKGRISQVIFAALSKIQTDREAMTEYYLKTVSLSTLIAFPVIIGFATVCDLAVPVIMGDKWVAAIPILRVLGMSSIFEVSVYPGAIYQAMGQTKAYLKMIFITRITTALGIMAALLLGYGLDGVALSIVITSLISFFVYNHYVGKVIAVTHASITRLVVENGTFSIVMGGLILAFRAISAGHIPMQAELAVSVLIGAGVYFLLMKKYHPEILTVKRLG